MGGALSPALCSSAKLAPSLGHSEFGAGRNTPPACLLKLCDKSNHPRVASRSLLMDAQILLNGLAITGALLQAVALLQAPGGLCRGSEVSCP